MVDQGKSVGQGHLAQIGGAICHPRVIALGGLAPLIDITSAYQPLWNPSGIGNVLTSLGHHEARGRIGRLYTEAQEAKGRLGQYIPGHFRSPGVMNCD